MATQEQAQRLEGVYQAYADRLYRLSVSILRSCSDAEDCVADTFCRYLEKAPAFADGEHEKAWLIRVCVNCCRDLMRRRKLRAWLPLEDAAELTAAVPGTPALDAVSKLPEVYRCAVVLYHLEQLSIRETAAALSLSESAVKMRLSRAREMLRAELNDMDWR